MLIRAIYENGVFRPMDPVQLPEGAMVQIQAPDEVIDVRALVPPGTDENLVRIYEILGQSYNSGYTDAAQRHNEHQP
jgi:predicted DNA-binding antitoxin AbrB/MazE fold protein